MKVDTSDTSQRHDVENKGKDRPARTPHVAFVVVSHYRLQIIFFVLTSMS